jgi:amino acid adenylation domain-containing protein
MMDIEENIAASLAGRVWETVRKYPAYAALELGDRQYSYKELYDAAASVMRAITELDDPNPFVAIMADKSFTCYAGILGILLAGKAYLPVNPRFPAARNLFMFEKARIRVIIAGENADEELEEILDIYPEDVFIIFPEEMEWRQESGLPPRIIEPGQPAYLLFTSGTTGNPKGVPVSHANVCWYLDQMMQYFDFGTDDRFTQLFDLTFDLSVHDLFLAWSSGACLVVPPDNSSFAMARFIREKQPTVWFSVPSVVNLMDRMRLLKKGAFPSIRLSFFCGEALPLRPAQAWKTAAGHSRLVNLYGPTEATIAVSYYELAEDPQSWKSEMGILSIGKVFEGNYYLLHDTGPENSPGELCLAGKQVVEAYYDNEEADKEAFFKDPGSGQSWYKTGDLVKVDEEGDLFFLGRKDAEVKISGYRVNLKEIEYVLAGYQKVAQAVVIFDVDAEGQGITQAFILLKENAAQAEKELDAHCRQQLPWYMVPGKFIFVKEIPLNANGKIDTIALKKSLTDGK